ncbi:MAG TPA: hypothetical protein PKX48_07275 [Planctomycetota bacterium]|nr:hypothetical protein [Planctomycetota bacterium]HNR98813.1 hypothetical protein [Planctomycetota bacterium]HNU26589.1 hypothetical protein [Planctomycetota bacterium]HOE29201.1 hypothetical protein [Planctomycetota bacterium]HOE86477.1 hypothetical protein [Planctomycetota bacterium]
MRRLPLVFALFLPCGAAAAFEPDRPNAVEFPPARARYVRLVIPRSEQGAPCIDELEIYGPDGSLNLALAAGGAKASASSLLPGYAIHQVAHLNDGRYGNAWSWIAAGTGREWAQIELAAPAAVSRVVFSRDREGRYKDRMPAAVEVHLSLDGAVWTVAARVGDVPCLPDGPLTEEDLLEYAFAWEDAAWRKIDGRDSTARILAQFEDMIARFAARGLDVRRERAELAELRRRQAVRPAAGAADALRREARTAKRRLFLREPALAAAARILFVKRHPYTPSHNYSVIFDAEGGPGGGVCVLEIPRVDGRLAPAGAKLRVLFDAGEGIARDPAASFDARTIYFGYRKTKNDYFHLMAVPAAGGPAAALTDGPFHDYFPCPLPDGGLAFVSTRCKARFLCWRPQAFVLFRMDADGGNLRALSHANLSEWTPSLMRDGRILWMRSEYLDKGADFGHTLWSIRPDGTHADLVFGNNTLNCYANGCEVPDSAEILCTLVSHGGDLNGPLALIDPTKGRFNPAAITSITPDVAPHYHMSWARERCFRDPFPIDRDYYLCSHAPAEIFGLYAVDRWGNRELLYLDPAIGSMAPAPLRAVAPPPAVAAAFAGKAPPRGRFFVRDVHIGLGPEVPRGRVKYLRVCSEEKAELRRLPNGEYQSDHEPFEDWYATPTHKVRGPHGWPSYVAKGVFGLAPVEADGSAHFWAPAGKVLYFQVLDGDLNEVQRMRSVVQLQPGEERGCIGCHEDRATAPPAGRPMPLALARPASELQAPPWGAGPFSYERAVQPVWDAHCVRCHDSADSRGIDLSAARDGAHVPASYRTLIEGGFVHYFDFTWGREHAKAAPLAFGTVKSPLWRLLEAGHEGAAPARDELHAVKCWIDLNCPLWPDYRFRGERGGAAAPPAAPDGAGAGERRP